MKKICVFDVNETLLDLSMLDPEFKRIFGDAAVRKLWFAQFIQSAMVSIITNSYKPFGEIGANALEMTAEKQGISLSDEDKKSIVGLIPKLPAHPDVADGIKKLKDGGFTIVALTNSTQEIAKQQLNNAGLAPMFDRIISAEAVKQLKPAKGPYEHVAEEFSVSTDNLIMIAAHAWDIAGAKSAGCKTAFIARPGAIADRLNDPPDVSGKDLQEVAEEIVSKF